MPPELKGFLESEAEKNGRSLNSEIVRRLQATAEASGVINRLDDEPEGDYVARMLDALKYQILNYADLIEEVKHHLEDQSGG